MADPRERWNDSEESLRTVVDRHLGDVWTAMPVKVVEDSKGHTSRLQPTIKGWERQDDGKTKAVPMPELGMVPIQYSAGGGFTITHPVKKNDEGIAIFASRCIDGWWDKGGVQEEPYRRRHHLSDAMYIPGIRAKPRQLGGDDTKKSTLADDDPNALADQKKGKPPSTVSVQIRTDDGDYYIELGPEGKVAIVCKTFVVKADEKVRFETKLFETTGEIRSKGDVTAGANVSTKTEIVDNNKQQQFDLPFDAPGFVDDPDVAAADPIQDPRGPLGPPVATPLASNVSLLNHRHGQVQPGSGTTGGPV